MRALGLMSGTSMDGVDAAMLDTDGETIFGFGESGFRAFSDEEREVLAAAQGLWPGGNANVLTAAAEVVHHGHAEAVAGLQGAEVIGFHGQTLVHAPREGRTHQLGDGARLATAAGVPVVWDFRSDDIAAGGQGAPLAPFFHHACARWAGLEEPVCFLNLGGVGNVTWLDPRIEDPADPAAMIAFDTGPANALIDDFTKRRTGQRMDIGGSLAASGLPDMELIAAHDEPFFAESPPKSLDRNGFRWLVDAVEAMSDGDGAATLTAFTVHSVRESLPHLPSLPSRWLICGGGRHNTRMMQGLAEALYVPVEPVEAIGLDGDMLEAQAFAYLAVRVLRGLPTSAPGTTGCRASVSGGRVSEPSVSKVAARL
ncbi:anhydro-N-acetylmuramic acid kinase [Pontivivens ytuae]|uniref:Anhydro-N-acetylmuramic acid kinase n=1 Tax=Pontivivens ytuae TaxID=2789856 RepID=A0A7S9LQT1_9RHOB|nr:anhydro-N-acetylmuramic acid kinase [Pontivivens ytuae]QPH53533.1 anhydro-N-acetylmuramic acid kinase [Pontivivens ytuae]